MSKQPKQPDKPFLALHNPRLGNLQDLESWLQWHNIGRRAKTDESDKTQQSLPKSTANVCSDDAPLDPASEVAR